MISTVGILFVLFITYISLDSIEYDKQQRKHFQRILDELNDRE